MFNKVVSLILISLLFVTLCSCSAYEPPNIVYPTLTPTDTPTPTPTSDATFTPPSQNQDYTGGLPRDDEGMLIGSFVFDAPILLIGMPRIDPDSYIRVRAKASLDGDVINRIVRGQVVEATEIVEGWYHVTVFPDMTVGYVHSAYLTEFVEPVADPNLPEDQGGPNEFLDVDPSGLQRGPDGLLIGSAEFDTPMQLMGMGSYDTVIINVRNGPSVDAYRTSSEYGTVTIGKGQRVEAYAVENGWYRVRVFPGMYEGYIRSDLLVPYDDTKNYYARDIKDFDTKMSPYEQVISASTLVDVRKVIPDIEYCIIFATPDNFTGKTQYSRDIPLLQQGTAEKLKAAQELFKQDGYRIKLYDAYRPSSVSGRLSSVINDTRYIARAGTSIHNRAAAVDITLIDANGNELEMPSPMHTFNSTAHRTSSSMSDEAKANMDYMTRIMQQVGMTGIISSEWWHFGDSESSMYLPMDIEFRDLAFTLG